MSFTVLIQPRAQQDLMEAHAWLAESSSEAADRWFEQIVTAIQGLSEMPYRCSAAVERDVFAQDIRQLLCGDYRVLFTIDGNEVHVLHIRHSARRRFGLV